MRSLISTFFAGVGLYFFYSYWKQQTHLSRQVREKLPDHHATIEDREGNYDIDGVSFDTEGVVVSSDDNKHLDPMKLH